MLYTWQKKAKNVIPSGLQKRYFFIKTAKVRFVNNRNVIDFSLQSRALFQGRDERAVWGGSQQGLKIRMVFEEPAENAEGVAENKKEIDDLIGQGGPYQKLTQQDQGGEGNSCGGFQGGIGLDVLRYRGAILIVVSDERFPELVFGKVMISEIAESSNVRFP